MIVKALIRRDDREEFHVYRVEETVGEFVLTEHVWVEWVPSSLFHGWARQVL